LDRTSGNRCGTRLCGVFETASIDHAGRDFPKFALHSKSVWEQSHVGSNPTRSAKKTRAHRALYFFDMRGFEGLRVKWRAGGTPDRAPPKPAGATESHPLHQQSAEKPCIHAGFRHFFFWWVLLRINKK
ncbi:MAG: hypothetical protein KBS44_01620, partial [Clostridiales bacterium]|nr:hypothetical protein [Candidatus Coliplasma equi]